MTDHPFKIGEQYTNRLGTYKVLEIRPPKMRVEYEHGGVADLDIITQARIAANMGREEQVLAATPPPKPPPRPRSTTPRATASRAATTSTAPAERAPRARAVRATAQRGPIMSWAALRDTGREEKAQALRSVLANREAFLALVDGGREAEHGRYWLPVLSEVRALNEGETVNRTSPPELFLSYSIVRDRSYLVAPHQLALACQFPINEGGNTADRLDLLGYDTQEERPLLLSVRVRTTTAQWLWEAMFQALNTWIELRATASFATSLGEYPLTEVPGIGVVAPRAYWQENDPQRSPTARANDSLSRELFAALSRWLEIPVLLMEVDDDWLRRVGSPTEPQIRLAHWPV